MTGGNSIKKTLQIPPFNKYLIRQANADFREVLGVIDLLRLLDGPTDNVVDYTQTELMIVKYRFEDFDHAPEAAVTDQYQGQNKLANPVFRHWQIKENLIVVS